MRVEIHEFSTGIEAEKVPGGEWRSRGFTVGEYMNSTLSNIPYPVERAIANKWFEVSEGAYSNVPAVVGRVVSGNGQGEEDWSVVAVVTRVGDDRGRSFGAYRYFLCKGADNIWMILDWMKQYQKKNNGGLPIFNPSEVKVPGKQEVHTVGGKPNAKLEWEWENWLSAESEPLIIQPGQRFTPEKINVMAEMKASGAPVSWAYNVEGLEKPESFIIIQAASVQSYEYLIQMREAIVGKTRRAISAGVDEAAIESAVKGLIQSSQVNEKNVETFISALQDSKVTTEDWQYIFKKLGAESALNGSVHPNDVRLLTLRAIALPTTLPQLLRRMVNREGKNKKENEQQKICREFQAQLRKKYNQYNLLEPLIAKGIGIVLKILLEEDENSIKVEAVAWLLRTEEGVWAAYRKKLIKNVCTDVIKIEREREMEG